MTWRTISARPYDASWTDRRGFSEDDADDGDDDGYIFDESAFNDLEEAGADGWVRLGRAVQVDSIKTRVESAFGFST